MAIHLKKCIICMADDTLSDKETSIYLSLPDDRSVIKCRRCGLKWLNPIPSKEDYEKMYKSEYFEDIPEDYDNLTLKKTLHFSERVKTIRKHIKKENIKLLDVGSATGEFVHEAQNAGIDAVGIEPSELAGRQAMEKYGINLRHGDFLDIDIEQNSFDVINMNHVFEHFSDPIGCLQKTKSTLSKDGLLVIEVPNQFDNIHYRILRLLRRLKPQPYSLYSIHHPFFYNAKNLSLLLINSGFSVIQIKTWKSHLKIKSGSFYPGASFIEHYVHAIGDIMFNGGLFIEIYAKKTNQGDS